MLTVIILTIISLFIWLNFFKDFDPYVKHTITIFAVLTSMVISYCIASFIPVKTIDISEDTSLTPINNRYIIQTKSEYIVFNSRNDIQIVDIRYTTIKEDSTAHIKTIRHLPVKNFWYYFSTKSVSKYVRYEIYLPKNSKPLFINGLNIHN